LKKTFWSVYNNEPALLIATAFLLVISVIMLGSLAPYLFPQYFLYIVLAIVAFILFSQIDFETLTIFHWHFYVMTLVLLLLPLIIGQATRGVVRWIQIGSFTLQPTEIIRPFIFIFFAQYLNNIEFTRVNIIKTFVLIAIPVGMIVLQPSLGVAVLTLIGIGGIVFSQEFDKRYILGMGILGVLASPIAWLIMQPYQRSRILGLIFPSQDLLGGGYNRIQSIIAVGSGELSGRGLGEGIQTQLAFLPERHTDFMFASIAEEFGLLGTLLILLIIFFIIFRFIKILEVAKNPVARGFISGVLFSFFVQTLVHAGMNMGIAPITGLPLPLVSAGGSSLIATMSTLGIVIQSKKDVSSL